ncbi:MAG: hypothetical protein F4121_07800 [Acidimicrobiia bacterium]|nr:hypothetical protein [Acidimicrobiia bacterium]MYI19963.1 hypothetical protein [Acidimicrobiia bacterium]
MLVAVGLDAAASVVASEPTLSNRDCLQRLIFAAWGEVRRAASLQLRAHMDSIECPCDSQII